MMEPRRLRDRMSQLERQMKEVRTVANRADDSAAHAHVRLDAQTKLMQALRDTQIEQGAELRQFRTEARQGFATLAAGQEAITQLLTENINSSEASDEP